MNEHFQHDCMNTGVYCNQCGMGKGEDQVNDRLLRHQLVDHLNNDCQGHSQCKVCPAQFQKGIKLPGKEFDHKCVDYVIRLLEEIVGPKAFQMAKDTLNFKLTEKKVISDPMKLMVKNQGTLEQLYQQAIENAEKRLLATLQRFRQESEDVKVAQGSRIKEAEHFIENQKLTNKFMKPFVSAEQSFTRVRKLPICGSQLVSNQFEWPSQSELRLITLENLAKSKLKKIEYHTGGSVWSIRITMSDGRQSPIFGTKNCIDTEVTLDPSREINEI